MSAEISSKTCRTRCSSSGLPRYGLPSQLPSRTRGMVKPKKPQQVGGTTKATRLPSTGKKKRLPPPQAGSGADSSGSGGGDGKKKKKPKSFLGLLTTGASFVGRWRVRLPCMSANLTDARPGHCAPPPNSLAYLLPLPQRCGVGMCGRVRSSGRQTATCSKPCCAGRWLSQTTLRAEWTAGGLQRLQMALLVAGCRPCMRCQAPPPPPAHTNTRPLTNTRHLAGTSASQRFRRRCARAA